MSAVTAIQMLCLALVVMAPLLVLIGFLIGSSVVIAADKTGVATGVDVLTDNTVSGA
jgi:hypothetical protein